MRYYWCLYTSLLNLCDGIAKGRRGESGGTGRGKIVEAAWQDRGAHDVAGSSGTGRCRTTGLTRVDPNRAVSRPNRVFVANCSYLATIERLIQVTSHAKRLAALALDQQAAYDNTTTYQIDESLKAAGAPTIFRKYMASYL